MLTEKVETRRAIVRRGLATIDITPPVGIYHRLWGAASHERASGIHRPLQADVLVIGPVDGKLPLFVRVQLDHVGFVESQHKAFINVVHEATGVPPEQVMITCSHTHSGGWFVPDRIALPGGELIEGYLESLREKLRECALQALDNQATAVLEYATGSCAMAADRNCRDDKRGISVCGFNPGVPSPDQVTAIRITSSTGKPRGTIVHYACHPTSLGWESSLISPDFVGALRDVVEQQTGQPCVYFQGACGELGPRDGFVGDTDVADRNGRSVGFAALSALELLGPPQTNFVYSGPVVSGATLGAWKHLPISETQRRSATRLTGGCFTIELPKRTDLDATQLTRDQAQWLSAAQTAETAGDLAKARDNRAYAERAKRWLARIKELPSGPRFSLDCSIHRLGDSLWITTGGEPFHWLQAELSRRFPNLEIVVSPLAGNLQAAYLLPHDDYGKGLYQEEPSLPAPGCLEELCNSLTSRIQHLLTQELS